MKNFKGFTLIELLIVISIIGILAVSLLPSVLGAPARARDAARKADVNNIVAVVESYNSSTGSYPTTAVLCIDPTKNTPAEADTEMGKLNKEFKGGKAPLSQGASATQIIPGCTPGQYVYCKLSSPNNYAIGTYMEIEGSTKGYRATGDCTDANAKADDATGHYYFSVQ